MIGGPAGKVTRTGGTSGAGSDVVSNKKLSVSDA